MNKSTMGLIAGGLIGAAGAAIIMGDKRSRKRIVRDTKRIARRASDMM